MSKFLFLVMCVLYYLALSSSAPIIKASGVQWSEPKGTGKGNVSLVMIPLNDLGDNDSDVIVAVKSDYQILTHDTQILNLMVQENVNNNTNTSTDSKQCQNESGNSEEQQSEINKIKSPNTANYFGSEDKITKNYFRPLVNVQNTTVYGKYVTPQYTDTISKSPFFNTAKSVFVQEALDIRDNLQSDPSYIDGVVKSNDSDINSLSNKIKDGEILNTNIKHSNKQYLASDVRNGEYNDNESNKFDNSKSYRSNLEANVGVLCLSSTMKTDLPVTTTVDTILPTAVSQETAQNHEHVLSSEGNPNVTSEVGTVNSDLRNNSVVSEMLNTIGKTETQNAPQSSFQNSVTINTTQTLTTISSITQNFSTLSSTEIPTAVSLVTLTTIGSSVSREETVPNHIQHTASLINEASSPLAGKDNDNEVIKALCANIATESNNITGVFEQISKMMEPHIRLEETTTVMSAIGPSDIAQIFTVQSSENQTFTQNPSHCVHNDFKEKLRYQKKITPESSKLCQPRGMIINQSTLFHGEENEARLKDMNVLLPLVRPPEEMQQEKDILIKSDYSQNKVRLTDSHENNNDIGERKYKLKNYTKWLPITENEIISNTPKTSEVKSNSEQKIVLDQHLHNKEVYMNPNEKGILKINVAGKNLVLERKSDRYKYDAPRKSVEICNQLEEKSHDISAEEINTQNVKTKNHFEDNQKTLFDSSRKPTKKSNFKVKNTNCFNPTHFITTKSTLSCHGLSETLKEENKLSKFPSLNTSTAKSFATSKQNNKESLSFSLAEYKNISSKSHSSQDLNDNKCRDQNELSMRDMTDSSCMSPITYNLSDMPHNNDPLTTTTLPMFITYVFGGIKPQSYKVSKQMTDEEKVDQPQYNKSNYKQTKKNISTEEISFTTSIINAKQSDNKPNNENIVIPLNSAKEIVIQIEKYTKTPLTL